MWPLPTPDAEFVRYFGTIRRRKRGGVEGWIGESEICEADKALRFSNSLQYTTSSLNPSILLRCPFKRLYFDGKAVGKYEIGICPKSRNALEFTREEFNKFTQYCLRLPVLIQNPDETIDRCSLASAGKPLARLYTSATTSQTFLNKPHDWWVVPSAPLLFVEFNIKDIKIPFWSKPVITSTDHEFQLFHSLVPYAGSWLRKWILISYKNLWGFREYHYNRARDLRISLLRLNAEHECLRITLRNILNNRININSRSIQSDALQDYLNTATARIAKIETVSTKIFDTEIMEIARESFNKISPGQKDTLLQTLEGLDIRPNVFKKLERYTKQWVGSSEVKICMVNEGDTYNIAQSGASGRYARSDNNTFYYSDQTKTLSEAAAEIQQLLKQLEQSNPSASESEKIAYINDETTRSFQRRVASALQASGETAIDEFILENKYLKVVKAAIKSWFQSDS
ncbi:hypothetical protein NDI44_27125 [Trichocoleus sp. DQ-A3]